MSISLNLINAKYSFLLQGISTAHLSPFEVLSAIQHTQHRLQYEFTADDFLHGKVGEYMLPDDFDFEKTVSSMNLLFVTLTILVH